MPEATDWTIELDTGFTDVDVDALARLSDELERGYGYLGPSVALHEGRLAMTATVAAAKPEIALLAAVSALSSALDNIGFHPETRVEIERINMESRELAFA